MSAPQRNRRPGAVALWLLVVVPIALYALNPFDATVNAASGHWFGHTVFRVPSKSMAPAIPPDTYVVVDVRATSAHAAKRGDIVAYHRDGEPEPLYLSRIVAIGGDRIEIRGRVVTLNGEVLEEPHAYWEHDVDVEVAETVVPGDRVFLLGDNRANSIDSRFMGAIVRSNLNGVVRRRL